MTVPRIIARPPRAAASSGRADAGPGARRRLRRLRRRVDAIDDAQDRRVDRHVVAARATRAPARPGRRSRRRRRRRATSSVGDQVPRREAPARRARAAGRPAASPAARRASRRVAQTSPDHAPEDHRAPRRAREPSTMPTTTSLSATSAPTVKSRTRLPCATMTRSPGPGVQAVDRDDQPVGARRPPAVSRTHQQQLAPGEARRLPRRPEPPDDPAQDHAQLPAWAFARDFTAAADFVGLGALLGAAPPWAFAPWPRASRPAPSARRLGGRVLAAPRSCARSADATACPAGARSSSSSSLAT